MDRLEGIERHRLNGFEALVTVLLEAVWAWIRVGVENAEKSQM